MTSEHKLYIYIEIQSVEIIPYQCVLFRHRPTEFPEMKIRKASFFHFLSFIEELLQFISFALKGLAAECGNLHFSGLY